MTTTPISTQTAASAIPVTPASVPARMSSTELHALNARFDHASPKEILQWATDRFGDKLVMTSSFGADAMCTIHLATQVKPDIRIIVVNTGYLFQETLVFL